MVIKQQQHLPQLHTSHVEQTTRSSICVSVRPFIGIVNDLLDSRLDNDLSALITREQRDIDATVCDIGDVFVQHCVQLRMTDCRAEE